MAAKQEEVRWSGINDIEILKWKVRKGSMVSKGSVLALYVCAGDSIKSQSVKLKSKDSGLVIQISADEGTVVHPGELLLVIHPQTDVTCTHPTIMKDMCADCGADLRREMGTAGDRMKSVSASVAMVHSIPELIVSQEQALELGKEDENRLLRERKLVLLVDLDQTLVHTTNDNIPPNLKDVKHFQLWHGKNYMWYHTRIRPFTQQFLDAVSKLYELHICTFGVRMYAHIIARLLDPDEKHFSHRILSRDECFDPLSKTANLKALFPCGDKMVGIIDDREDVWNHAPNLVHVKPYRFFQGTADINAPPGLTKSEHDNEPISHKLVDQSKHKKDGSVSKIEETQKQHEALKVCEKQKHNCEDYEVDGKQENTYVGSNVPLRIADEGTKTPEVSSVDEKISALEEEKKEKTVLSLTGSKIADDNNFDEKCTIDVRDVKDSKLGDSQVSPNSADVVIKQEDIKSSHGLEAETADGDVKQSSESVDSQSMMLNNSTKGADENNKDIVAGTSNPGDSQSDSECKTAQGDQTGEQSGQDEIEWSDDDDYLLHLEEILTRIHKAYYGMYEQCQRNGSNKLPDLKNIIPYVRKKTLKDANIVFSGMFPLNVGLEKSRPYAVAKALGANIQNDIVPRKAKNGNSSEATTHLVAAKAGTGKHKTALKTKGIHIVSGEWLWTCSERWEWAEESIYPLVSKDTLSKSAGSPEESTPRLEKSEHKKRKTGEKMVPDADEDVFGEKNESLEFNASSKKLKLDHQEQKKDSENQHCLSASNVIEVTHVQGLTKVSDPQPSTSASSVIEVSEENFANSFNPLYSFSDEDIEFMDKEVDELMDEEEGSSEESDEEREARLRGDVLGKVDQSDSDSDSLSGDLPRGWKMHRKLFSPNKKGDDEEKETDAGDDDETENELTRYQKNMVAFAGDESESVSGRDEDSIGSVDDEIAEAVEKEFLASL